MLGYCLPKSHYWCKQTALAWPFCEGSHLWVLTASSPYSLAQGKNWPRLWRHVLWCSICRMPRWRNRCTLSASPLVGATIKMILNFLHTHSQPCSSMLALHLSSLIRFRTRKRIGDQPHWQWVVLLATPNFNPYSKQWAMLWLICLLMSICPKLN